MRKWAFIAFAAIVLTACSNADESVEEKETDNAQNQNEQAEDTTTVTFRKMDVTVEEDTIQLSGEAQTDANNIYFTFKQGDNVLVDDNQIELEKNEQGWASFSIGLELNEKIKNTEEVPIVILYGKNDSGEKMDKNHVPVDLSSLE
ncbi:hypothetical protein [Lentibacillus juripiscarius]|uniref:Bacterial spore germination immunoglobulin-like domain-containing protein n=1 Tax=Lentibacillus juripiscarius TaxID=257446 RepID=A0ABW5V7U5_9BACI